MICKRGDNCTTMYFVVRGWVEEIKHFPAQPRMVGRDTGESRLQRSSTAPSGIRRRKQRKQRNVLSSTQLPSLDEHPKEATQPRRRRKRKEGVRMISSIVNQLGPKSYFGQEAMLIADSVYPSTMRCRTECHLMSLHLSDLTVCCAMHALMRHLVILMM